MKKKLFSRLTAFFMAAVLLFFQGNTLLAEAASDTQNLTFGSETLYEEVKSSLDDDSIPYTDLGNNTLQMSQSDINSVTSLIIYPLSTRLFTLKGIEQFPNLTELKIYNANLCSVEDESILIQLCPQLTTLSIRSSYINSSLLTTIDFSNLESLTLRDMYMEDYHQQFIRDISWMAQQDFSKLKYLSLECNSITDISYLTADHFPNLKELYLNTNNITNIDPLFCFTNLSALGLSENPLTDESITNIGRLTNLQLLTIGSLSKYLGISHYWTFSNNWRGSITTVEPFKALLNNNTDVNFYHQPITDFAGFENNDKELFHSLYYQLPNSYEGGVSVDVSTVTDEHTPLGVLKRTLDPTDPLYCSSYSLTNCTFSNGKITFDNDQTYACISINDGRLTDSSFYFSVTPASITPTVAYNVTEGANGTVTYGEAKEYTFRIDGDLSKFSSISVDGTVLADTNYTTQSGSTIITLNSFYMETLPVGEHTFLFTFTDGSATTTLTVKTAESTLNPSPELHEPAPTSSESTFGSLDTTGQEVTTPQSTTTQAPVTPTAPKTGDDTNILLPAIAILLASSVCSILYFKKYKLSKRLIVST